MRKLFSLGLALLLLTACGTAAAPPTATPPPTAIPATAVPPTASPPAKLTLTASDGVKLTADYYAPVIAAGQKAPGVLFLHMYGGSRADWKSLARQLQAQGIASLALDFRGFGASPGPEDWNKSREDAALAWQTLLAQPGIDPQRTAIVGASVGANLALVVGARNAGVAAVVALSPGDDFLGVAPASDLASFASRPVYLIASQDDAYSYTTVQHLAPHLTAGETYFYTTSGHAMAMFSQTDLATRLLAWLGAKLS